MRRASDEPSLYTLLGVAPTASWEEVRRAFREAVRANHPDLHGGDPAAEQRLKHLNAVWESVNTPGKWAAYILPARDARTPGGARRAAGGGSVDPTVGRLHVRRARRGSAGLRSWSLELDGDVVARIENGGESLIEAQPGRRRLRVFYDRYSSPELTVDVRAGHQIALGCRQYESVRVSLFSPRRSLVIERLDDHVV